MHQVKLRIEEELSVRWAILEPVVSHGIDAVAMAVVVHGTSLALKTILPDEYYLAIHKIELFFYVALCGALSIYTLLVFCFSLYLQFFDSAKGTEKSVIINTEHLLFPDPTYEGIISPKVPDKTEDKVT